MKYKFWITSSRGTNESAIVSLPKSYKEPEIKAELEHWCSQFGAWQVGECFCRYGYEPQESQEAKRP